MQPANHLMALFATLLSTSSLCAAPAEKIIGQWQQSDLTGMGQSNKSCTWLSYLTRKLTVDTAPDGSLVGTYTNYEQSVWTLRGEPDCKFGVPTMSKALFQRTRMWPVRLTRLGEQRWKLSASAAQCAGDACSDSNLWTSGFETELRLEGAQLVDQGNGVSGTSKLLRYRPAAEAMKASGSAASALAKLLQPLDSGECNGFFAQSLHPQSPLQGHQNDFCNLRRQMKSLQQQPIVDSNIINSVALDRVVQPGRAESIADVLLIGAAVFQDGSTLPRIVTLRQQQGVWKVVALLAQ